MGNVTTTTEEEIEAAELQEGTHQEPGEQPNAQAMGAESAEYTEPRNDPQWMNAWKLEVDPVTEKEYGIPVRLPRGQWTSGGPNALIRQRRADGGRYFTAVEPKNLRPEAQHECFVGTCKKRVYTRIKLVHHVKAFHHEEAELYRDVLARIEASVASEDPRLQKLLAGLESGVECGVCGANSPAGHDNPQGWLRGHTMGAHKEA